MLTTLDLNLIAKVILPYLTEADLARLTCAAKFSESALSDSEIYLKAYFEQFFCEGYANLIGPQTSYKTLIPLYQRARKSLVGNESWAEVISKCNDVSPSLAVGLLPTAEHIMTLRLELLTLKDSSVEALQLKHLAFRYLLTSRYAFYNYPTCPTEHLWLRKLAGVERFLTLYSEFKELILDWCCENLIYIRDSYSNSVSDYVKFVQQIPAFAEEMKHRFIQNPNVLLSEFWCVLRFFKAFSDDPSMCKIAIEYLAKNDCHAYQKVIYSTYPSYYANNRTTLVLRLERPPGRPHADVFDCTRKRNNAFEGCGARMLEAVVISHRELGNICSDFKSISYQAAFERQIAVVLREKVLANDFTLDEPLEVDEYAPKPATLREWVVKHVGKSPEALLELIEYPITVSASAETVFAGAGAGELAGAGCAAVSPS